VRQIFPGLSDRPLTILYPSINCAFFDDQMERLSEDDQNPEMVNIIKELSPELFNVWRNKENVKFLSFNRFERKKDVALAIHAFGKSFY
jgi:glycosyltransferase involved in cell wall biosynthesis